MDFVELEAIEGLRWSWNSWPLLSDNSSLIIPLSIMCTPLMHFNELPILPYDPLICSQCGAVLNPYARVDYQSRIWVCPFCYRKNPFQKTYLGINENNVPAELFPTYSTVEYHLGKKDLAQNPNFGNSSLLSKTASFSGLDLGKKGLAQNSNSSSNFGNSSLLLKMASFSGSNSGLDLGKKGLAQNSNSGSNFGNPSLLSKMALFSGSNSGLDWVDPTYSTVECHLGKKGLGQNPNLSSNFGNASFLGSSSGLDWASYGLGPAFVFVVDSCISDEELRVVKNELLHVIAQLPETALVGLVVFDSMVRVYDLGFGECCRVVMFHGERELSSEQTKQLLGIHRVKYQAGMVHMAPKQGFLIPISEGEFSITSAIEDIHSSPQVMPDHRPLRATGVAVSVAVGLLEGCLVSAGSRIMIFTSGPATIGPGMIVSSDFGNAIRNQRDIGNGYAPYYKKSSEFYKQISRRLSDSSIALDLFACSLDQVGAAELRAPVESSGGFMMLTESFDSDQFRKCLRHIFSHDEAGNLKMCLDATIEIVTTKDVKICGALGSCVSLQKKNGSVSDKEIGEGGTYMWKLGALTDKMCIAFFFEVGDEQKAQPSSAFFIQFITRYRYGSIGIRKRVITAARRWVPNHSPEIAAGFDQEAAASVMTRLAIHRAESNFSQDIVRWLDKNLIRFASKFGDYVPEDPSSFRLATNLSLFPQFMYYLRRSQFIDVFNCTPDETAFFRLLLNREGVVGSLIMVQPTLFQYSFDGPPVPVLLDICSVSPDIILLFDSYFYVVIHYGSKIAQWRKLGYDKDPSHDSFRKLLEAPEIDAEQLVSERIPVPKLIKCDQHSSQARFLLAKLNPSVTHNSTYTQGSDIIFTEELSLQVFIEHLQALAVQG
ncbi:hypothetical protein K7X08_026915 [Anisodus acutangulus]|uniref:Protein transport protein SEC23 n=1 Tax=Anisodus acutangulus TaxID=402998 RepID=A0A9Q1L9U0_9SOLA|nr:hypothetical protein K7X08_026915 [Anisodus acutangulus]